jgi:hypothetical protein
MIYDIWYMIILFSTLIDNPEVFKLDILITLYIKLSS